MYFFNYFMDLEKSPQEILKDKWYTTNLENIDSILGMSPINNYSAFEETIKTTKNFGRKNRKMENNVYTNLSTNEVKNIQKEIRKQINLLTKGVKLNRYFDEYNNFTGLNDSYLFNSDTITKSIRKNKSTNLFMIDKSKLPASFRQTFETASGEAVNNLAIYENVINNINDTQTINNIIDENAIDMEN